jgi:hypothetical protein
MYVAPNVKNLSLQKHTCASIVLANSFLNPSDDGLNTAATDWIFWLLEGHLETALAGGFLPHLTTKRRFGPVRSPRSVFASSTEIPRNSLILIDFFSHCRPLRHHRFGLRFGIQNVGRPAPKNTFKIFVLQGAKNGVRGSVNP